MNVSNNINGISNSINIINKSADKVSAVLTDSSVDLAREFTSQTVAQTTTEANVNATKTQDEMLETLLDIKV